jgi:hypothetical protein
MRTPSSAAPMRAVSAARAQPLAQAQPGSTGTRLKSGAADTALNALSLLRDVWEDFRSSDRFFKYKAFIIVTWLLLSVSGFVVACPQSGEANDIGAHLVVAGEANQPIYMIKNAGNEPWKDVVVVVNEKYRAAFAQILPNGDITLTPKLLTGPNGKPPSPDLKVTELEVQTSDGATRLLRGGEVVK